MDYTEFFKLCGMLANNDDDIYIMPLYRGWHLHGEQYDVVQHQFSYGGEEGLLELSCNGEDDSIGSLTAEKAFKIINNRGI